MNRAYIAFGANLANPRDMLLRVVEVFGESGMQIDAVSPLYQSPAWPPGSNVPDYINAVMAVESDLSPEALLDFLLATEAMLGRTRSYRNAPRPVDLDLIDVARCIISTPRLTLPHPRMADRAFVLLPLRDVAPGWSHPDGRGLAELIEGVDCSETHRIT